jgi:hypothetical protein
MNDSVILANIQTSRISCSKTAFCVFLKSLSFPFLSYILSSYIFCVFVNGMLLSSLSSMYHLPLHTAPKNTSRSSSTQCHCSVTKQCNWWTSWMMMCCLSSLRREYGGLEPSANILFARSKSVKNYEFSHYGPQIRHRSKTEIISYKENSSVLG